MGRAEDTPTYHVVGFKRGSMRDKFPPAIIEERVSGIAINRYTAYDHGTYFTLYPMSGGKLVASNVPYTRKNIDIKKHGGTFEMNDYNEKKTSTTPTKAQVEVTEKGERQVPSSSKVYHGEFTLSTPFKEKICNLPRERYCKRCGKWYWQRTAEYPFGAYCSDSCKRLSEKPTKPKKESRPVNQYTREGGYIMTFENAEEAAYYVGLKSPEHIRRCCRGESRTSAGYIWKWKEDA